MGQNAAGRSRRQDQQRAKNAQQRQQWDKRDQEVGRGLGQGDNDG